MGTNQFIWHTIHVIGQKKWFFFVVNPSPDAKQQQICSSAKEKEEKTIERDRDKMNEKQKSFKSSRKLSKP